VAFSVVSEIELYIIVPVLLWAFCAVSEINIYNLSRCRLWCPVGRAGAVAVGAGLRSRPENKYKTIRI
jgi:hypothetical protein